MAERQIWPRSRDDRDYYSQLLTEIDCRAKDRLSESRAVGQREVQALQDFIAELRSTAHNLEEFFHDIYRDQACGSDSPSCPPADYFEPQLFPDEPSTGFSNHGYQVPTPASTSLPQSPFELGSTVSIPPQLLDKCHSDGFFVHETTVNPSSVSDPYPVLQRTRTVTPSSRSSSLISRSREGGRPRNKPSSLQVNLRPKTKSMASSRLSSLKEADKRNPTKGRARTRLAAPSHPSSEGTSVVHKLIQGVGSITSVIQLKESVQAFRHQRVASNMGLPQSTKEIWNRLDLLENNTHTNNILHRLFLVQLDLRRKELNVSMKGIVKKVPSWVIDRIAKDAEEGDRTKVISRLHAGVVWSTISDEFSTGVLALIPTQKAHWPSNTAVEKLNQKDLAGFLNKAKNDRYSLIKGAAQRVTRLIPLFEGKGCEAMLKMEQVGVEVLQHIQNESDILQFLDCL